MRKDPEPSVMSRRQLLSSATGLGIAGLSIQGLARPAEALARAQTAGHDLLTTKIAVDVVRVTHRTNWIFVRLGTNKGLTGLGEASLGRATELPELEQFFAFIDGESPLDILGYRRRAWAAAGRGRPAATAFSAIEQALWDLTGKALGAPIHQLFGERNARPLPVYANINRATTERTPSGFAENAVKAVGEGFSAIKAAPFDGFPGPGSSSADIRDAVDLGIDCIAEMRSAIGDDVKLKIDAHSNFDVDLAVDVARRIEHLSLSWYEEPVTPEDLESTLAIRDAIPQRLAGGEFLFAVEGFRPLCLEQAVEVIMPDVKHCGGILEMSRISSLGEAQGIAVAPHNPSGPVSTAVSAQICSALPNFEILEFQWGEASWRADLVDPPENFQKGELVPAEGPGLGVTLNEKVLREHLL